MSLGFGCAIAVYNQIPGSDPAATVSINSWGRVLDAMREIVDRCWPYGGSQSVVNGNIFRAFGGKPYGKGSDSIQV